jgi:hypothetical protein
MKVYEWTELFDKMEYSELRKTKEALENLPSIIKTEFEGLTFVLEIAKHELNYRDSGFKRGV